MALASDPPHGGIKRLLRSNPAHFLWRPLIERDGVPFIKVELLRDNPARVFGLENWPAIVSAKAPGLFPLINKHLLLHQSELAGLRARIKKRSISVSAFITRDDVWARARRRLPMYANLLGWRVLTIALPVRRALRGWLEKPKSG